MAITRIIDEARVDAHMSKAVVFGNFVFLSGQVASISASGNVADQTRETLQIIDTILANVGTNKNRVISATVHLADISTFDEMNEAWNLWVSKTNPPARTTVEARLARPEYKVEITIIAALVD